MTNALSFFLLARSNIHLHVNGNSRRNAHFHGRLEHICVTSTDFRFSWNNLSSLHPLPFMLLLFHGSLFLRLAWIVFLEETYQKQLDFSQILQKTISKGVRGTRKAECPAKKWKSADATQTCPKVTYISTEITKGRLRARLFNVCRLPPSVFPQNALPFLHPTRLP